MKLNVSMTNIALALTIVVSVAVTAHPASAQGLPPLPGTTTVQKPLSIKLGAYFLTSGTARSYGQSTQFSAGADYAIAKTGSNSPSLPSVYFDYQGGNKNGGHVQTYGGGIATRSFTSTPSGGNAAKISPYFGAGAGLYHVQTKQPTQSGQVTSFGGKLLAGLEFTNSLFVEANYQFLPSKNGINPSGFGVQLGLRF